MMVYDKEAAPKEPIDQDRLQDTLGRLRGSVRHTCIRCSGSLLNGSRFQGEIFQIAADHLIIVSDGMSRTIQFEQIVEFKNDYVPERAIAA